MAQPRIETRTLISNLIISPFQGLISKSGFVHQDFILTLIIKPLWGCLKSIRLIFPKAKKYYRQGRNPWKEKFQKTYTNLYRLVKRIIQVFPNGEIDYKQG